ncbi:DUF998 domain-containing protein [Paenarthrobacter sp. PH39-S1]|uniref:DUF998 domain-containing protein n=1 Tax=Paenarthrobacter sp. PH39-S1 TaxID=3046204 RepID=UPI0024BA7C41|nr:DUF998 domain-containing protein [Paenarthrobacter sp. PH39-S1]MDJ0356671.1 DUF998 domain-containing protein [Paenarthrobacter sp. PH39-S1]
MFLKAGVAIAPWFLVLSLLQALIRPGFNLTKHELSLLLVGPFGWVQTINFLVSGLLGIAFAVGLRRLLHSGKAGIWGPALVGAFGFLFLIAGICHPDPQLGFPVGAPEGVPTLQSLPSNIHSIAFSALALAIVAAACVFVCKFAADQDRAWAIFSSVCAIAIIAFVGTGGALMPSSNGGLALLGAAIAITGWVSVTALHLLREGHTSATARIQSLNELRDPKTPRNIER